MAATDRPRTAGPTRRSVLLGGVAMAVATATGCSAPAALTTGTDGRPTLRVLAFQAPSLGAFLPAVISARGIDLDHGLRLAFSYATPDNYNTEFASGHYQVGGSAALLSEALRTERGVDTTYLFNLFDFFSAVVSSDPAIHTLDDLRGRQLAAATGTTNHAMFTWFAAKAGLNLGKVQLMNQTTAGLSTMARLGRADATELWEPAYSSLLAIAPKIRSLDIGLANWNSVYGTQTIPYLGLAAHRSWAQAHQDVVSLLYRIYADAAQWTTQHPAPAAAIIAKATPKGKAKTLQHLIENPRRLGLDVRPAQALQAEIAHVFDAGRSTGYLSKTPPTTVVYRGL